MKYPGFGSKLLTYLAPYAPLTLEAPNETKSSRAGQEGLEERWRSTTASTAAHYRYSARCGIDREQDQKVVLLQGIGSNVHIAGCAPSWRVPLECTVRLFADTYSKRLEISRGECPCFQEIRTLAIYYGSTFSTMTVRSSAQISSPSRNASA